MAWILHQVQALITHASACEVRAVYTYTYVLLLLDRSGPGPLSVALKNFSTRSSKFEFACDAQCTSCMRSGIGKLLACCVLE